ncbi:zinc finger protein 2-like, partial [Clarias magur]
IVDKACAVKELLLWKPEHVCRCSGELISTSCLSADQLGEEMQTEVCSASDSRTSRSAGHVAPDPVDQQRNGEIWEKPLKAEETGEDQDEDHFYRGTSSCVDNGEDRQDGELHILIKEEEPKHDDFLYCQDCRSVFISKCEVHGPALFIPDVAVPLGVADRARQTLPPGLEIRKSGIPDAGLGVFNNGDTIPAGVHFGPYQGDTVDREEAMNSAYSWVIHKSEQCEKYIDATSEMHSNWMRYVNCARNNDEQNLVAFQYQGGILYRSSRPIEPGQELLLWYEEFTKDHLGLTFNYIWNRKCSLNARADQLGEEMQTEVCSTSDGRTSSSAGHVAPVDRHRNGEIWEKPLKEEETHDDEDFLYGGTSSSLEDLTPEDQQNLGLQIILKEEEPEHDDYLYCEECKTYFVNKCDVHGPALFIPDVAVPLGVADRAKQTLPPGLEIRKSSIPDAGLGVFNNSDTIPVGVHFGPYQGDTVDREEAMNSAYSWVVYQSEQCEKYIDATSEMNSNWMRYVNCARNEREQNLVAFQYQGGILYRCSQPIEPGQELLMWYEEDYAKDVTFDFLWNKKCSEN